MQYDNVILQPDYFSHLKCVFPVLDEECYDLQLYELVYEENEGTPIYQILDSPLDAGNAVPGRIEAFSYDYGVDVVKVVEIRGDCEDTIMYNVVGHPLASVPPMRAPLRLFECDDAIEAYGILDNVSLIQFLVANYPVIVEKSGIDIRKEYDVDFIVYARDCKILKKRARSSVSSGPEEGGDYEIFTQYDHDDFDGASFTSLVYDIRKIDVCGEPFYKVKIKGPQIDCNDEIFCYMTLYVPKNNFPEGLHAGDLIRGSGWVQGIVHSER